MDSIAKQLKALKNERAGGSPDARWLASAKSTLMMQIGNTVRREQPIARRAFLSESFRLFLPVSLKRAMIAPALALVIVAAGAGASSASVMAARETLPGDALYKVKLAAERLEVRFAPRAERAERRIDIAGRRLEEMARLAARSEPERETRIAQVAGYFSEEMAAVRKDLAALQMEKDADAAVRIAANVDAKVDEYQIFFRNGFAAGRPTLRMALLNLDQVSVQALEILVEKQSLASHLLPEAQLTSSVGKRIESFAAHVAVAQDSLKVETEAIAPQSLLLAAKAQEAVEEAKELLSQGDFRAAVRKVSESASLVSEAEAAKEEPADATISSTETLQVESATNAQ